MLPPDREQVRTDQTTGDRHIGTIAQIMRSVVPIDSLVEEKHQEDV